MKIDNEQTKIEMLLVIVKDIAGWPNPGDDINYIYFTDDNGLFLAKLPFDSAQVGSDSTIEFKFRGNTKLANFVEDTGKASKFYISKWDAVGPPEDNIIITGTVGLIIDFNADILFNNITWAVNNTIDANNIKIKLEEVCLQR